MSSSPEIDNLAPAFSAVTADDHAGWIIITSCVFLIFSFLALFAKLLIAHRRPAAPGFRRYDALLVAAFVCELIAGCIFGIDFADTGQHLDFYLSPDSMRRLRLQKWVGEVQNRGR